MKVVITARGPTLEDDVDPRFGRCRTFLVADTETGEVQAVPNEAATLGSGAGVKAAQTAVDTGAKAVLTGRVGPKAAQVLDAAGVPVYTEASGSAGKALNDFKQGWLKIMESAVPAGGRGGGGRGGGMGRGRGQGR